jgi:ATP-dependent Clp protease ATP-binding subunit ClpX
MYPPKGRKPRPKFVEVNTQNILFIAGGAFDGIEKLETTEPSGCRLFNFKNVDNIDKDNLLQYIIPKDIKDFG